MAYEYDKMGVFLNEDKNNKHASIQGTREAFVVVVFDHSVNEGLETTSESDRKVSSSFFPLTEILEPFEIVYQAPWFSNTRVSRADLHRAKVAKKLLSRHDDLDACFGDCIPKGIALKGRPNVMMYLYSFQYMSLDDLADAAGVEPDTIKRYRRRF